MHRRTRAVSCVDGPRLARENVACRTEVACSHVSGLFTQSGWTAGPDGVREPRPHHSNGIDVPMNRQVWLGCVGSTDCAITRHCSLASSRTWLSGLSRRGHALVVLMPVHHSIALSAVAPRLLAVLRLMTSSNLVGAWTGRSPAFSPLRMRSTYPAARRNWSTTSGP